MEGKIYPDNIFDSSVKISYLSNKRNSKYLSINEIQAIKAIKILYFDPIRPLNLHEPEPEKIYGHEG